MGRNMVNGKVILGDRKLKEMKAGGDEKSLIDVRSRAKIAAREKLRGMRDVVPAKNKQINKEMINHEKSE